MLRQVELAEGVEPSLVEGLEGEARKPLTGGIALAGSHRWIERQSMGRRTWQGGIRSSGSGCRGYLNRRLWQLDMIRQLVTTAEAQLLLMLVLLLRLEEVQVLQVVQHLVGGLVLLQVSLAGEAKEELIKKNYN